MSTPGGFLLDTNIISELARESPNASVTGWFVRQAVDSLLISVITLGELVHGAARVPAGARRDRLEEWLQRDLRQQFAGRLLGFGEAEAIAWGQLRASAENKGRPRAAIDLQLAATAQVAGLTLATRNVRDFEGLGLPLFDPWS